MIAPQYTAFAVPGIPSIQPQDNLAQHIITALSGASLTLQPEDVVVVSSKVVSKAEGRFINLQDVVPTPKAYQLAQETGKDPRLVQLILEESVAISRKARGVLVTVHRLGFVSANAGIDQSNVGKDDCALLLPSDPDASADALRQQLESAYGCRLAVVISDTHGRPFRIGNVGVAIGVSGMEALVDLRGKSDLFGRVLQISLQAYADLVASAAHLLCGESDEGLPVIILRGLKYQVGHGRAYHLYRPPEEDLYR